MSRRLPSFVSRWPDGAHLLVAVSGGADSVALLRLLCRHRERHPIRLTVVHLNHGIRGTAADRDEAFVRQLARELKVPCVVGRARVPDAAARSGESLEMSARKARHAFFRRVLQRTGAYAVAVAHTADDQAETVLLRLLRGCGLQGLGGIALETNLDNLRVVRPLLGATRAEIESFLRAEGFAWREDRTNRDRSILRNRVRHELLPYLEKRFQPAIRRIICRTAETLREAQALLEPLAAQAFAQCVDAAGRLSVARLRKLDPALRSHVVLRWLRARGVPEARLGRSVTARVLSLLEGASRAEVSGGMRAIRLRGRLMLARDERRAAEEPTAAPLRVPGRVAWSGGVVLTAERSTGIVRPPLQRPGRLPAIATIRSPRRGEALQVRAPWPGARIAPIGMSGSTKLQDVLVNAKVPRSRRAQIPVVACGDEVVWVPGYRIARRWAVPGESARSVTLRAGLV